MELFLSLLNGEKVGTKSTSKVEDREAGGPFLHNFLDCVDLSPDDLYCVGAKKTFLGRAITQWSRILHSTYGYIRPMVQIE